MTVDRLLLVLGDQLDQRYPSHAGLNPACDGLFMAEVGAESTHVASHVQRTALFLSAMRHYAEEQRANGWRVHYRKLTDEGNAGDLRGEILRACRSLSPRCVVVIQPGEWRVLEIVRQAAADADVALDVVGDPHFLCDRETFQRWAAGRKTMVLEHFYRLMRRRLGVLIDEDGQPEGGAWNFDAENRAALGGDAPPPARPARFAPDEITRQVMSDLAQALPNLPGDRDSFGWPVTRAQALSALDDFVRHRLAHFGTYQDAMATGEPWLFHSLLSPPLNLKLLDPRECVTAAVDAWAAGAAPINAVEGFVRQIVGWREFVRGVYWQQGPAYGDRNGLDQHGRLPGFYWSGESDMACVAQAVGQVLAHGYAHHIQRLMVTGNLALMLGVRPREVADWYLGMFVDGVDWVTTPNTVGMAMHADGGVVGTKPYASTGRYIARMSDYCHGCRYRPDRRVGEDACPFGALYWAFLDRNRGRLAGSGRMGLALRNLDRVSAEELERMRARADALREAWGVGPIESGASARGTDL